MTSDEELRERMMMLEKRVLDLERSLAGQDGYDRREYKRRWIAERRCRQSVDTCRQPTKGTVDKKVTPSSLPTSPLAKKLAALFNRALTTAWTPKEIAAFKSLSKDYPAAIDEMPVMEAYYAAERRKGDDGIHRRSLAPFLNNFPGELDRARAWRSARRSTNGSQGPRVVAEPPDFPAWLAENYPDQARRAWASLSAPVQDEFRREMKGRT